MERNPKVGSHATFWYAISHKSKWGNHKNATYEGSGRQHLALLRLFQGWLCCFLLSSEFWSRFLLKCKHTYPSLQRCYTCAEIPSIFWDNFVQSFLRAVWHLDQPHKSELSCSSCTALCSHRVLEAAELSISCEAPSQLPDALACLLSLSLNLPSAPPKRGQAHPHIHPKSEQAVSRLINGLLKICIVEPNFRLLDLTPAPHVVGSRG